MYYLIKKEGIIKFTFEVIFNVFLNKFNFVSKEIKNKFNFKNKIIIIYLITPKISLKCHMLKIIILYLFNIRLLISRYNIIIKVIK